MGHVLFSKNSIALSCASLTLLPGCILERTELLVHKVSYPYHELVHQSNAIVQSSLDISRPYITIWIHGTRFFSAAVFRDVYERQPGLKPRKLFNEQSSLGKIARALHETYYCSESSGGVYLFGWSGKLSFTAREIAAKALFFQIDKLVSNMMQQYHIVPHIRIITHSHGGNVALNMAAYFGQQETNWTINELILLACPVQGKTMHNVHSDLFEKIYSLYSSIDIIQLLDPQWIFDRHNASAFFSKRDFPHNEKVTQVRITIDSHGLMHTAFSDEYIVRLLPIIIDEIEVWGTSQPCGLIPWWYPAKKLLSIYTNGRIIYPNRYAMQNAKKLKRLARRVPLKRLNFDC